MGCQALYRCASKLGYSDIKTSLIGHFFFIINYYNCILFAFLFLFYFGVTWEYEPVFFKSGWMEMCLEVLQLSSPKFKQNIYTIILFAVGRSYRYLAIEAEWTRQKPWIHFKEVYIQFNSHVINVKHPSNLIRGTVTKQKSDRGWSSWILCWDGNRILFWPGVWT